jgi:hypothetical protein
MVSNVLAVQVEAVAKAAGLVVVSTETGEKYAGGATTKFLLALATDPAKTQLLELSEAFEFGRADLMDGVKRYMAEATMRLRNPRPDCYLTLGGLPLSFGQFGWPFHESTSGADTSLVHGEVRLQDGNESILHAKVAVSMTVTFRDVVAAPEQPFAEGFIFNAVRKTMDQGQPTARSAHHALLQHEAAKIRVQRHYGKTAPGIPRGQALLALRSAGRERTGLAAGPA